MWLKCFVFENEDKGFFYIVNTMAVVELRVPYEQPWAFLEFIEAEWRTNTSVNLTLLVKITDCRLVGAKHLSEPLLEYC